MLSPILGMFEPTATGRQTEHLNSLDRNMILFFRKQLKYTDWFETHPFSEPDR